MPGAALQELWGLVGTAETALSVVSAMVVATALLGMVTMILTTLNERRREMAILRSVGARPATILGLLDTEAGMLTLAGVVLGTFFSTPHSLLLQPLRRPHLRSASRYRPPDSRANGSRSATIVARRVPGRAVCRPCGPTGCRSPTA